MRTRIASILVVLLMAFTLVPAAVVSNSQPAQAVDVINCTSFKISSDEVRIQCTAAGIIVLNTVVDLPAGPTVEVNVPGPTQTVTVRVPGPRTTQTIEVAVPGPTKSVTATAPPVTSTETVTAGGPTKSSTVTETVKATQTVTTTPSSTGQVDNGGGTIDQDTDPPSDPVVSIPDINTPAQAAAVGGLILLGLSLLALLALFAGYYFGYKDSDKENAGFMAGMVQRIKER